MLLSVVHDYLYDVVNVYRKLSKKPAEQNIAYKESLRIDQAKVQELLSQTREVSCSGCGCVSSACLCWYPMPMEIHGTMPANVWVDTVVCIIVSWVWWHMSIFLGMLTSVLNQVSVTFTEADGWTAPFIVSTFYCVNRIILQLKPWSVVN